MKRLLLFLCLLTGTLHAQVLPGHFFKVPPPFYPTNPAHWSGTLVTTGSPVSYSLTAYQGPGYKALLPENQPTLTISGNTYTVDWTGVQTDRLSRIMPRLWLELRANGVVILNDYIEFRYTSAPIDPLAIYNVNVSSLTWADLSALSNRIDSLGSVGYLTITSSDARYRKQSTPITYAELPDKPTIPTSATQVGALPLSYSTTQAGIDAGQNTAIAGKQATLGFTPYNATNPAGYITEPPVVATFALAKAAITTGVPKSFTITNNEIFGAATHSRYDGTNWTHSPALLQNN